MDHRRLVCAGCEGPLGGVPLAYMPTAVVVSSFYPVPPDQAAELLRDPAWLEERHRAIGELDVRAVVEPAGTGFRVVLTRRKEMDLPAVAKKVFGGSNQLRDEITWRRD